MLWIESERLSSEDFAMPCALTEPETCVASTARPSPLLKRWTGSTTATAELLDCRHAPMTSEWHIPFPSFRRDLIFSHLGDGRPRANFAEKVSPALGLRDF